MAWWRSGGNQWVLDYKDPFLCLMKESLYQWVWVFTPVWKLFNTFLVHYSSFSFCFLMSKVCLYALFWNHFRGSLGWIQTTDLGRSYFPKHECYEGRFMTGFKKWMISYFLRITGAYWQTMSQTSKYNKPSLETRLCLMMATSLSFNLGARSINHLLEKSHDTPIACQDTTGHDRWQTILSYLLSRR